MYLFILKKYIFYVFINVTVSEFNMKMHFD